MVKRLEYRRPWMYAKQVEALYTPARFSWIEASTKAGKTFGAMTWLFEMALRQVINGKKCYNYWWVAPVSSVADIAFARYKRSINSAFYVANEQKKTLTLPNGSIIWFKSADKPDSLYGEDVGALVCDEASRMKEGAYTAVFSTLTATKGLARYIGNVKGRGNWFYKGGKKAQQGLKNHAYFKITAADAVAAGVFDKDVLDDAAAALPKPVFDELYYCIPSDDGGNPFGIKSISACQIPALSNKPPVVWGWDLARSVDWTCGIALDEDGNMCRFEHFQKPWTQTVNIIALMVGDTHTLVDSTGVGDAIAAFIQTKCSNVEGYVFSSKSKQILMEGLALSINQQMLGINGEALIRELNEFEYRYERTGVKYSAPEGLHDDCVMALALARHAYHNKPDDLFIYV